MRLLLLLSVILSALTGAVAPARAPASAVAASVAASVPATAAVRAAGLQMPSVPASSAWPVATRFVAPLAMAAPTPREIWMDRRRE